MGDRAKSPFVNVRCRLQRLKDAKFFGGWVTELSAETLHVKLSTRTELSQGDTFSVQIHGATNTALFNAWLANQQDGQLVFVVHEKVRYLPPTETARVSVADVFGRMSTEEQEVEFQVADASTRGCGVVTHIAVDRGQKLEMHFDTPHGPVHCAGEVRYCRPDADHPEHFRLGIRFDQMPRLEFARWSKLFEFDEEAAA